MMIMNWVHYVGPTCQICLLTVCILIIKSHPVFISSDGMLSSPANFPHFKDLLRPANLENVFRGTFRVKKRDLPAKSGTVGRAHNELFFRSVGEERFLIRAP